MTRAHIHLHPEQPLAQQGGKGHNRWHPDIAPAVRVASGSTVEMDTIDGLDRQIKTGMTAADLLTVDMGRIHPLTGPVYVEGAEPGDLLAVRIEAVETASRGFTFVMPGFGFLREHFPDPYIVHWEMSGGFAESAQLPGVRIPGAPFMGVMGVAPSLELLTKINTREADLLARGGAVLPPDSASAVPGDPAISATAIRTIAPHETGGNVDIKQLTAGATLFLPVYQRGGLFSVGDAHFAQGDGESCGTAVETSAKFVAKFDVLKGEARRRKQNDPSYEHPGFFTSPEMGVPRRFYATTGIPVSRDGMRNESENLTLAATNALLNMVDYLVDARGFTRHQAYCLISVAVDLKVSQVVDVPNLIVSAFLPLDIFTG
ncbi:MAG TPA: acetamidase/formamidase family protein [Burkholderiales bacterium]|nr:acetamidase/formamidase family protein [Burkholderiales bacterium]